MTSSQKVRLDQNAHMKVLLHAAKFPVCPVYGLLLGTIHAEGQSTEVSVVSEALPLSHSHPLAPSIELALMQAEKYAEKESMKLLGWYHVGELVNGAADTAVQQGPVAPSLLSKLVTSMAKGAVDAKQSLKSIIAYSVDPQWFVTTNNTRDTKILDQVWTLSLSAFSKSSTSAPLTLLDSKNVIVESEESEEGTSGVFNRLKTAKTHLTIYDFEEHLDDLSVDWTNRAFSVSEKKKST